MPILSIVKMLFFKILFFNILICIAAHGLFAAPLESGYSLAPRASASPEERDRAYINARLKVIESAKKYLGTPYRYGGMTSAGLDCSGFLCLSFMDALGVSLPRSAAGLYTWTVRIPLERAQPGDFLFFRTGNNNTITHVGLYLGDRTFIHSASAGARTGVIYSSLDEQYWANTFAGAGRAFPESTPFSIDGSSSVASAGSPARQNRQVTPSNNINNSSNNSNNRLLVGVAFAPTWNGFLHNGDLIRGFSSLFCIGLEKGNEAKRFLGLEFRPEYDGALGVFRLPITLSIENNKYKFFTGPVVSFGDAVLSTDNGKRYYSGGTSWLGTFGVAFSPFIIKTQKGEFSPYFETAWQSYFSNNRNSNFNADLSAGLRFSTGIRWMIPVL